MLRAKGICVSCNRSPSLAGKARCDGCRQRRRERSYPKERIYARLRRLGRKALVIHCQGCGEAGHNVPKCPFKDVPRCRCGLALPCNDCVPSAVVFGERRRAWE